MTTKKPTVKVQLLQSLWNQWGSTPFRYTDLVKEILVINGWIRTRDEYNWRIHRGYYAVAFTKYSSDYLFNFSKGCPFRLVNDGNRYRVETQGLTSYQTTTLNVLTRIKNEKGPQALSEEGHKTLADLQAISNTTDSKIMRSLRGILMANSTELYYKIDGIDEDGFERVAVQTEALIRKLITDAFEAGVEAVTYDETNGYSTSITSDEYLNSVLEIK